MPAITTTAEDPPRLRQRQAAWQLASGPTGSVRITGVVAQPAEVRYASRVPPGHDVPPGFLRLWIDQGPRSILYCATQPIPSTATHHAMAAKTAAALRAGTRVTVHGTTLSVCRKAGADYLQILGVTLIELLDASTTATTRTGS